MPELPGVGEDQASSAEAAVGSAIPSSELWNGVLAPETNGADVVGAPQFMT